MTDVPPENPPQAQNPADSNVPVLESWAEKVLPTVESLLKDVETLWTAVFGANTRPVTPEPSEKE